MRARSAYWYSWTDSGSISRFCFAQFQTIYEGDYLVFLDLLSETLHVALRRTGCSEGRLERTGKGRRNGRGAHPHLLCEVYVLGPTSFDVLDGCVLCHHSLCVYLRLREARDRANASRHCLSLDVAVVKRVRREDGFEEDSGAVSEIHGLPEVISSSRVLVSELHLRRRIVYWQTEGYRSSSAKFQTRV